MLILKEQIEEINRKLSSIERDCKYIENKIDNHENGDCDCEDQYESNKRKSFYKSCPNIISDLEDDLEIIEEEINELKKEKRESEYFYLEGFNLFPETLGNYFEEINRIESIKEFSDDWFEIKFKR